MNFDKLWLGTCRKLAFLLGTITLYAFASMLALARAPQEPVELRCRGARDALVDAYVIDKLDGDTLSLNFNVSARAAGPDSKGLDPGTCSWIDRTFKEDEWRQVHFQVTAAQAESIPAYLKNPNNYWVFFVTSSDRGYFEARSHGLWRAGARQPVPDKPSALPGKPAPLPNNPAPAESEPNTPLASFGGEWNMAAGPGSTQFKLILQQDGSKVTGTFSPQEGTIDGTVSGKTLSFQWTQAGGYKGTGQMEMGGDSKSLTGIFTIVEGPKKGENRVIGERAEDAPQPAPQPSTPPASFAGTWDTVAGGEYKYTMKVEQSGDKVTGTFAPGSGKLEGTVQANVLRLHFTQNPKLKGSARLTLAMMGNLSEVPRTVPMIPMPMDKTGPARAKALPPMPT